MTKPNYGVQVICYWLLSVCLELLQKYWQEEKEAQYLQDEALYKPFKISSSQKNDMDLLGLGGTLARLPRIALSLFPMRGSRTGLISADEPLGLKSHVNAKDPRF